MASVNAMASVFADFRTTAVLISLHNKQTECECVCVKEMNDAPMRGWNYEANGWMLLFITWLAAFLLYS